MEFVMRYDKITIEIIYGKSRRKYKINGNQVCKDLFDGVQFDLEMDSRFDTNPNKPKNIKWKCVFREKYKNTDGNEVLIKKYENINFNK